MPSLPVQNGFWAAGGFGRRFVVTQLLTAEGGKTRLTVTAKYDSRETRDTVIGTGMEKGAAISYDRLEDLVQLLQR